MATLNPLMVKDVKMSLRYRRAAILQVVFLGSCFLGTWFLWPQEGVYSQTSQSAHTLFTVLGMGQLALVALFAPAFTSSAFTMEKERNTFDLLYGSAMSPFTIVSGKIVGALTFLMLVVLSSIPVTSTCLVLGGVGPGAVWRLYYILALTGLMFGMIGLAVSAVSQNTYKAVIGTYVLIVVLSAVVAVPAAMFLERTHGAVKSALHIMRAVSPFTAMSYVVQPGVFTDPTLERPDNMFIRMSIIAIGALTAFLFLYLRRCPSQKPRSRQAYVEAMAKRLAKWPFYLINPLGRRRMIGRLFNPVLIKELRTMLFGRVVYLVRGMYLCIVVSLLLTHLAARSSYEHKPLHIAAFAVAFQTALVLFLAPIFSAPLISSEIESQRLDLLRLTKIPSWRIVSGKFQSVIIPLLFLMIATLPPYLALGRIKPDLVPRLVRSSITLVATLFFIASTGLFLSSVSRKTSTAIAATYVVVVVTCVVGLLGLLAQGRFSESLLQRMFVINPVVTMLSEIGPQELRQTFNLWLPNLRFLIGGTLVMLALATVRVAKLMTPE